MEGFINDEKSNSREHKTGAGSAKRYTNSSRTSEANSWEGAGSSGTDFQSNGDTKANRGRSNSSDPRLPLPAHFRSETPVSDASGHRLEVRRFDEIQSIKTLEIPVTGWGRLRDLRDDLLKAIKDAANKIRAYRNSQKVFDVGNFRNNEIIDTFEKATRYSAENMLKLEKLDPALSAFREFYSDKLHGISKDVISNNIDSWRKIGSDIISRDINGNDDFNSVMRLG